MIQEITIAGRSLEKAQQAAAEVGPKAQLQQLDADDDEAITAALNSGDVLLSFMWDRNKYLEPLAQAAIAASAHFCDLGGPPPSPELVAAAREAGVTVLIGTGSAPGAHNLAEVDTLDDAYLAELQSMLPEVPSGLPLIDKGIEYLD